MKKLPCSGPGCAEVRIHHERPAEPRGIITVEVPDDYEGQAFCSIACFSYFAAAKSEDKITSEDLASS